MTDEHTLFARLQEAEADLAAARAHIARLEAQLSLTVTRHEKIESELRLKSAALEAAASGVMITDRQGIIQWINPAFTHLTGYTLEECIGQSPRDLIHSGLETTMFFENLWETITAGKTWHSEVINRRKDGTLYTEEQTVTPVRNEAGEITHFISIKQDISDRKRAEARINHLNVELSRWVHERSVQLDQTQIRMEAILNYSMDGLLLAWTDCHIQQTNPAFNTLLGCQPGAYLNQSLLNLIPPDERPRVEGVLQVVVGEQTGKRLEIPIIRLDGTSFEAELSIGYVHADAEQAAGFVCAIRDITERNQTQRALAEERNLLRTLIDTAPEFIYIKDTQHRFILSNSAHAEARGHTRPEEMIGKTDADYFAPEHAEQFKAEEEDIFRTGIPMIDYEQPSRGVRDEDIWISLNKVPLRNLKGEIIGLVCITHDITERKQAEDALRRSEEQLRESQRILQTVLDTIPVRVFWKDRHSMYLGCNQLFSQDAGITDTAAIIGKHDRDLPWSESEIEIYLARDEEVMGSGIPVLAYETTNTLADGTQITVQANKLPLRDAQGQVIGLIGAYTDITERKRAEDALRQSEERLRESQQMLQSVLDTIPIGVFWKDRDSVYQGCSRHYAEDAGLTSPAEIIGKRDHDLPWAGDKADNYIRSDREILDKGTPKIAFEDQRWIARDKPIWTTTTKVPLRNRDGQIVGILGAYMDITQRIEAENQLRLYAAEVADLYNNAPCGYHSLDANGLIVRINDMELKWLGYTREEVQGKLSFMDIATAKSKQTFAENFPVFMKRGWVADLEMEFIRKDGSIIPTLVSATAIYDEQGKFIMSRSTLFDITDRKRVEDALRESETRYRLLAENITDLVIRLDPAANYTYVSPSSRRLLGYEPEEMVGRSGFDFIHPDDLPVIQDASIRAITERQPYSPLAVRFIHKEGRYVWMEISGQSVFSEETGEVMEFITISRNIDAERAAQHALRESEERLRILFESVPDAIFLLTHDGMLSDVNPAAVTLCGMPREDILGKHFMDLNLIDPTWHGFSENAVLNISSTAPESMEFELLHPDGDRRMIEVLVHPVTLRGQGYNLAIARDMTLRKRYEESLKNALQKERDLSQLKSRFLSIASHEFRNPLAVIMTSADLLVHYRHKMAESDITDRLIKIQQQVNHLKAIMEDVLELEGLEQGRIRYNPAEGDLDVLCREILDEFRTSPGQTHQLVYTGPDWPKFTTFDPRLMRQVITNLISNAIKYSPKAQSVWVQLEYQDTQAMLQVRDEGIGIPPEELSHLFEAFHRAANVGKIPGSGLGLSIVKQSVDLHNGGVSVESQINAGTVFTVTLPV